MLREILILLIFSFSLTDPCKHPIYCQGPIFQAVQTLEIFTDCKTFVDMPLKYSVEETLQKWSQVKDPKDKDQVKQFLQDNFLPVGSDTEEVIPSDWTDSPPFLYRVSDPGLQQWGAEINDIWKTLSKRFIMDESQSSLLECPFPFMIAGGRFREFYYWDSLWITQGLILSGMIDTAINQLKNFVHFINKIGYVPNGARVYFLGRSQPPIATLMAGYIYEHLIKQGDFERAQQLLDDVLDALLKEYSFWIKNRSVQASQVFEDDTLKNILLFHYDGQSIPRPESYREDLTLSKTSQNPEQLFRNIQAACESGLDFSSRWFKEAMDQSTLRTTDIIPVDLNVFMVRVGEILQGLAKIQGNIQIGEQIRLETQDRRNLIITNFFNSNTKQWNDYIMSEKRFNENFYPSNLFPIIFEKVDITDGTINFLNQLLSQYPGGIPSSQVENKQQWDLPNAWAPLNDFVIEALYRNASEELALKFAQAWINNNYCSYQNSKKQYGTGYMYEKYDATIVGKQGGGGEYEIQTGFGWTNGVAIKLLYVFGPKLLAPQC